MHMSIVGFLQDSTSCGQLPLLLSVVLCAPQSSREEYKLYKQPLQKIICIKSLSGLKIASSSVSWTLQADRSTGIVRPWMEACGVQPQDR